MGWSYYGERGRILVWQSIIKPYKAIYVILVFMGAVMALGTFWIIADELIILMTIPNIICILLLNGIIARETKYYLKGDNINKLDKTPIPVIGSKRR